MADQGVREIQLNGKQLGFVVRSNPAYKPAAPAPEREPAEAAA